MKNTKTIIVGSGVAAVAVARRILQRNKSSQVIILEAGGDIPIGGLQVQGFYRKWTDFVMTKIPPTRSCEDEKEDADICGNGGFILVGSRLISRGGTTNHWGGWCPRMKPEDFRLGEVRKDSINWAIEYKDIANYYTEAEAFLHVCGDSASKSVPRFGENYPYEPVPFTALDGLLIPTLNELKYGYEPLPIARNPNRCMTTGTCRYCPMDARYAAGSDLSSLQDEFKGRVEVRIDSPVVFIKMREKKTAEGVIFRNPLSNTNEFMTADRIIIAAGSIESPKLLLASANCNYWQDGIGNDSGHVGRHLVTHPLLRAVATIPSNKKHLEQEIDFPTMACRYFDSENYQCQGKMFFVRDGKYIQIQIAERLISGMDTECIGHEIELKTRIELRGLIEAFPSEENRVSIAPGVSKFCLPKSSVVYNETDVTKTARIENLKRLKEILSKAGLKDAPPLDSTGARADHATGTCRMSPCPKDGVVDSNLRVHEVDNLYVCSNAVFPNSGAVNPTLTLVALALRLGDVLEPI